MVEYGTTQNGKQDAFGNVQNEIENVRGIMTENIERVLERGERIDLLIDKTDRLGGTAQDFRVSSRGLRRKMWWKNVKVGCELCRESGAVPLTILMVDDGASLLGDYLHPLRPSRLWLRTSR